MCSPSGNLEEQLEMAIENLRQINVIVTDFQAQSQTVFNQKIQKIVSDLHEIDKLKTSVMDVMIPLDVLQSIDEGRNPQLYTKECLSKTKEKNEEVKGKIDNFRRLKANLLLELREQFPKQIDKFRALRETR